jgi:predicted ATP-dependent serine protease
MLGEARGLADGCGCTGGDVVRSLSDRMRTTRYVPLHLTQYARQVLGRPEQGFSTFAWGLQGSGKSHLGLKLADEMSRPGGGASLLVMGEEKEGSAPMLLRAKRMRVNPRNVHVLYTTTLDAIRTALSSGRYAFAVIDSINVFARGKTTAEDVLRLRQEFPKVSFFFIGHADKSNRFAAGARDWGYLVDIEIKAHRGGRAEIVKNRYTEQEVPYTHQIY